jgi:uncharacterized protein YodC (DUF2158 family)
MELKPGDVVILKSGGLPLTVAEIHDEEVECVWMSDTGGLFRETLPLAVLESADTGTSEDDEEADEHEEEEEEEDEDDDDHKGRKKSKVA